MRRLELRMLQKLNFLSRTSIVFRMMRGCEWVGWIDSKEGCDVQQALSMRSPRQSHLLVQEFEKTARTYLIHLIYHSSYI